MISKKEIFTFSNLLSFIRLLMAIPIWFLFDSINRPGIRVSIIILCIIAAITDIMDGYLARKLNQVTEFGKVIDPLADKVIIASLVIKLFLIGELNSFLFFLIIGRDVLILSLSLLLANKLKKVLPSNYIGKATVIIISLNILLSIFQINRESIYYLTTYYGTIILSFLSIIVYIIRGLKTIKN
jgi:CDP-diacylglycerol--glycerol-3-phosphate 3-phosphatidyltransferase